MKCLAINGSPRKKWNTATLLKKALAGTESAGAESELVKFLSRAGKLLKIRFFPKSLFFKISVLCYY